MFRYYLQSGGSAYPVVELPSMVHSVAPGLQAYTYDEQHVATGANSLQPLIQFAKSKVRLPPRFMPERLRARPAHASVHAPPWHGTAGCMRQPRWRRALSLPSCLVPCCSSGAGRAMGTDAHSADGRGGAAAAASWHH